MYTVDVQELTDSTKDSDMKRFLSGATVFILTMAQAAVTFAGSSNNGGPAGDGGGGGSEPTLYALMLLSLLPGYYFARKAMAARPQPIRINQK